MQIARDYDCNAGIFTSHAMDRYSINILRILECEGSIWGNLMCVSITLENDSYMSILLGYRGYKRWNPILYFSWINWIRYYCFHNFTYFRHAKFCYFRNFRCFCYFVTLSYLLLVRQTHDIRLKFYINIKLITFIWMN